VLAVIWEKRGAEPTIGAMVEDIDEDGIRLEHPLTFNIHELIPWLVAPPHSQPFDQEVIQQMRGMEDVVLDGISHPDVGSLIALMKHSIASPSLQPASVRPQERSSFVCPAILQHNILPQAAPISVPKPC
jgi:hypothetical protein